MKTLKNKTRQPQVFNLDSPFHVGNANDTPFGKPCVISFLALERKEVDDSVVSCDSVKSALSKDILRDVTRPVKAAAKRVVVEKQKEVEKGGKKRS